ncbi:hypothetical protein PHYBOEH_009728 [Phytophthora boehmeriae]|uniref:RxLR effector protein n=1 Tax=Phytophthora boehmeriae TaxID=109152 RepID=A0A8T1VRW9_9STRA|nr:hypothetical protein PHYBOEH_009728 [Phytophthora boehmeriae]
MRISYALLMAAATLLASTDASTAAVGLTKLSEGANLIQSVDAAPIAGADKRHLRSQKAYDNVDSDDTLDALDDLDIDEIDADEEERGKALFGTKVFDKALKNDEKMNKYIDRLMANHVNLARLAEKLDLDPKATSAWTHKYNNIYLRLAAKRVANGLNN